MRRGIAALTAFLALALAAYAIFLIMQPSIVGTWVDDTGLVSFRFESDGFAYVSQPATAAFSAVVEYDAPSKRLVLRVPSGENDVLLQYGCELTADSMFLTDGQGGTLKLHRVPESGELQN